MRYKILLLFVMFFGVASRVDAALCDKEYISQLKGVAEQVEVSYEYVEHSEEILSGVSGSYSTNRYAINVGLMTDELYVNYDGKKYVFNAANDGNVVIGVNSGNVQLSIHSTKCGEYKLRSVTLDLPKFNTYYYKKECRGLEDKLDICDKWYQGTLNDNLFYKKINEYLEKDEVEIIFWNRVVDFFRGNSLIIVGGIFLGVLVVVGIVAYRKRSVLE